MFFRKNPIAHDECIALHYQKFWLSPSKPIRLSHQMWFDLPNRFSILEFEPTHTRSTWTYATCGMSQPQDRDPIELHLFCPEKRQEPIQILAACAHFHRNQQKLALGDTISFGQPWLPGSECTHGLLSLPYLDGPRFESMSQNLAKPVKFYWLIPVTQNEVKFKKEHGLKALEQLFEDLNFDFADPLRTSVC